jgi:redox-sensitive bicupin YhaK (pirin superfamily)
MKQIFEVRHSLEMHWVGNGFPVRSIFQYADLGKQLDPFLLLDYAGPHEFPPAKEKRGVGGHPHRGFETVTVCYQGEVEHRDSHGGGGKIGPGDVQWMTAASGLLHEEFHSAEFSRSGGTFEMIQLWVNLPAKDKSAPPRYQTLLKDQIPIVSLPDVAGQARVIAGALDGRHGPAKTFTPIDLWDVELRAEKPVQLSLPDGHTTALFFLSGEVELEEGKKAKSGDLVIFAREGEGASLRGKQDSRFLLMSGQPIGEPIVGRGPFVMNTEEEIRKAFDDFRHGRMGEL